MLVFLPARVAFKISDTAGITIIKPIILRALFAYNAYITNIIYIYMLIGHIYLLLYSSKFLPLLSGQPQSSCQSSAFFALWALALANRSPQPDRNAHCNYQACPISTTKAYSLLLCMWLHFSPHCYHQTIKFLPLQKSGKAPHTS